jgi:hypothetical protein
MDIPVWLQWESWGECRSETGNKCGFGSRLRLRQCSIFSDNEYGKTEKLLIDQCDGDHAEKELCNAGVEDCTDIESLSHNKYVLSSSSSQTYSFLTDTILCKDFTECCLKNPPMAMDSWISVDLEDRKEVNAVRIMIGEDLGSFEIRIGDERGRGELCIAKQEKVSVLAMPQVMLCNQPIQGQFLTIKKLGYESMTLCEIEAWGKSVESFWMNWSNWSQCSRSCGFGFHQRTRECHGGYPGHIGQGEK